MQFPTSSPTQSIWWASSEPAERRWPALSGELDVDVVVVGGGLSGTLCVHELLQKGVAPERIALVEARQVAGRASGRNAGFLLADLPEPYARIRASLGERAVRLRRSSLRNQQRLFAIGERVGADWMLERHGVLLAAASRHEEEEVAASIELLRSDGFEVDSLTASELSARLGTESAFGGMYDPAGGGCNPVGFVCAVAEHAAEQGVRIFEDTPAQAMQLSSDGEAVIETPEGLLRARLVVLATNAWAGETDDFLAEAVRPVRAQMLSFPATTQRILREVVYRNHGFEYFRQDALGRWHFGGFRQTAIEDEVGTEECLHAEVQQRLLDYARGLYPQLREVEPCQRWAGIMGFSKDGLPLIGPHPGRPSLLLALGFTGHGLGFAAEAARIVAELAVDGSAEDADLYRPDRLS